MAETQKIVVKHKQGCCLTCLIILVILFIGVPVLALVFKVAFFAAIIESIRRAAGGG